MTNPTVILTLLEPGPRSREEIAIELAAPTDLVKHELSRLVRAGQLKRTGNTQCYALASYIGRPGRPPVPGRQRRGHRLLCATCEIRQAKRDGLCRGCFTAAGGTWPEAPRVGGRPDAEPRSGVVSLWDVRRSVYLPSPGSIAFSLLYQVAR